MHARACMQSMFSRATKFNQPLGGWNTTNVDDFSYMFSGAKEFSQSLASWTVKEAKTEEMFDDSFDPELAPKGKICNLM